MSNNPPRTRSPEAGRRIAKLNGWLHTQMMKRPHLERFLGDNLVVDKLCRSFIVDVVGQQNKHMNAFTFAWGVRKVCEKYAHIFCGDDRNYIRAGKWTGPGMAKYLLENGSVQPLKGTPDKPYKVLKAYFIAMANYVLGKTNEVTERLKAYEARGEKDPEYQKFIDETLQWMVQDLYWTPDKKF